MWLSAKESRQVQFLCSSYLISKRCGVLNMVSLDDFGLNFGFARKPRASVGKPGMVFNEPNNYWLVFDENDSILGQFDKKEEAEICLNGYKKING